MKGEPKTERFEMRAPADLLRSVDDWRRQQPDLPSRSEAIRRLIEAGLKTSHGTPSSGGSGGSSKTDTPAKANRGSPAGNAPRAKPAAMSKEAQIRALREQGAG